jgi:DnaJ-domain-containing protein 1
MKYLVFSILLISIYPMAFAAVNRQPSTVNRQLPTDLNRSAFYKAMEENNKSLVNAQLEELKSAPEELKQAFMGAMLMKRASFIGSAASRLHYFREGHKMLESAIKQDPDNVEFRFLRLMVQEHAPKALGYKEDIEKDSDFIKKRYKSLPEEVQHTIEDYSKKSKLLKLDVS